MISRVIFRPAAESGLREAYDWYENVEVGLGRSFCGVWIVACE